MNTEFLFGRQYLEGVRVNYQSRVSVGALGGHLTRFRYEEIVSYPLHFQYPIGAQEENSHLIGKNPNLGFGESFWAYYVLPFSGLLRPQWGYGKISVPTG